MKTPNDSVNSVNSGMRVSTTALLITVKKMEIIQISNNKRLVKSRNQDNTLPLLKMMLCMYVTDMELHS